MDDQQRQPATAWERIQANREKNTGLVFEAGLRPELIRPATCPACGSQENAL
jgi:hypothetical protein